MLCHLIERLRYIHTYLQPINIQLVTDSTLNSINYMDTKLRSFTYLVLGSTAANSVPLKSFVQRDVKPILNCKIKPVPNLHLK